MTWNNLFSDVVSQSTLFILMSLLTLRWDFYGAVPSLPSQEPCNLSVSPTEGYLWHMTVVWSLQPQNYKYLKFHYEILNRFIKLQQVEREVKKQLLMLGGYDLGGV